MREDTRDCIEWGPYSTLQCIWLNKMNGLNENREEYWDIDKRSLWRIYMYDIRYWQMFESIRSPYNISISIIIFDSNVILLGSFVLWISSSFVGMLKMSKMSNRLWTYYILWKRINLEMSRECYEYYTYQVIWKPLRLARNKVFPRKVWHSTMRNFQMIKVLHSDLC